MGVIHTTQVEYRLNVIFPLKSSQRYWLLLHRSLGNASICIPSQSNSIQQHVKSPNRRLPSQDSFLLSFPLFSLVPSLRGRERARLVASHTSCIYTLFVQTVYISCECKFVSLSSKTSFINHLLLLKNHLLLSLRFHAQLNIAQIQLIMNEI